MSAGRDVLVAAGATVQGGGRGYPGGSGPGYGRTGVCDLLSVFLAPLYSVYPFVCSSLNAGAIVICYFGLCKSFLAMI